MDYLRSASFGGLFAAAFTVGATFQAAMGLLGLVVAVASPGMFKMNGAAATNPGQAFGTLVFILAFGLVMNAAISSVGAGLWLGVRRLLPKAPPAAV